MDKLSIQGYKSSMKSYIFSFVVTLLLFVILMIVKISFLYKICFTMIIFFILYLNLIQIYSYYRLLKINKILRKNGTLVKNIPFSIVYVKGVKFSKGKIISDGYGVRSAFSIYKVHQIEIKNEKGEKIKLTGSSSIDFALLDTKKTVNLLIDLNNPKYYFIDFGMTNYNLKLIEYDENFYINNLNKKCDYNRKKIVKKFSK